MFGLGGQELLIILAILLLLFGATRIPQLAGALGKSIKEFKKSTNEDEAKSKKTDEETEDEEAKSSA